MSKEIELCKNCPHAYDYNYWYWECLYKHKSFSVLIKKKDDFCIYGLIDKYISQGRSD